MKIHTLSFQTFGLTHSVRDFMEPHNCMDNQCWVVLYLLTRSLCSLNQNCFFSGIQIGCRERCSGVLMVGSLPSSSIVSPQRPPSGASLSSQWACPGTPPILLDYHLWTDWPYVYLERHKLCMPYYDVANLVTVTKTNMIQWNALLLCKNHCCENPAPSRLQSGLSCSRSLPHICPVVPGAPKFDYPQSQIL